MRTLIIGVVCLFVACAKPPPEKFSYYEDINSVVQIQLVGLGGHGTGFYIGDNLIMTAKHVVPYDIPYYYVDGTDGIQHNAEVIFKSKTLDVAILRTRHEHNLTPVKFAESNARTGDMVHTIGFPQVLGWCYSTGVVSSDTLRFVGQYKKSLEGAFEGEYFTMNMDIDKGISGAPIWNNEKRVVGMVNAMLPSGTFAWGLTVNSLKLALEEFHGQKD